MHLHHPIFFPKQFTVGVLNATLDLAALVLVGVVGFLGSEVVLSPVVSGCLPSCGGWVLVGVVGFLGSEVVLSPVVSRRLRLSPFMWGVGVGWCGRLLGLWSGLVSRCLPLSPVVSLHGCWLVWSASWALKWSCLPLSPVVSGCLPSCGGWVLVGVVGFLGSEVVLSPVVSRRLRLSPFMWGVGVGWCGRLLGLWSGLVSRCLPLSPFMWGVGVGWCGRLLGLWSGLVSRCLRLSSVLAQQHLDITAGLAGRKNSVATEAENWHENKKQQPVSLVAPPIPLLLCCGIHLEWGAVSPQQPCFDHSVKRVRAKVDQMCSWLLVFALLHVFTGCQSPPGLFHFY